MKCNKRIILILMAEQSLTQEKLAKKAGLTEQTVCNILRGKSCSGKSVKSIADALGVSVIDIVADEF